VNNNAEKRLFCISQGKVASGSLKVTWTNLQDVHVKFSQDLTYQKLLKQQQQRRRPFNGL